MTLSRAAVVGIVGLLSAGAAGAAPTTSALSGSAIAPPAQTAAPGHGVPTSSATMAERAIGIAVLNLQSSGDVAPELARSLSGLVAARLDRAGVFRVIAEEEVRRMVAFDQMKTSLACDDQASCLAEVGAALGVPFLLVGDVARIGDNFTLSFSLIRIDSGGVEKRTSALFPDINALLRGLDTEVEHVVASILYREQGALAVEANEESGTVAIDGSAVGVTPLAATPLSAGPHTITVDKEGFLRFVRSVVIEPRKTTRLSVSLRPSPALLAARQASAETTRTAAWITAGSGLLGALGGTVGLSWYAWQLGTLRDARGLTGDTAVGLVAADHDRMAAVFWSALSAGVLGAGLIATGATLFVVGDDPARYAAIDAPNTMATPEEAR
jgi:TolB-like protein